MHTNCLSHCNHALVVATPFWAKCILLDTVHTVLWVVTVEDNAADCTTSGCVLGKT